MEYNFTHKRATAELDISNSVDLIFQNIFNICGIISQMAAHMLPAYANGLQYAERRDDYYKKLGVPNERRD